MIVLIFKMLEDIMSIDLSEKSAKGRGALDAGTSDEAYRYKEKLYQMSQR